MHAARCASRRVSPGSRRLAIRKVMPKTRAKKRSKAARTSSAQTNLRRSDVRLFFPSASSLATWPYCYPNQKSCQANRREKLSDPVAGIEPTIYLSINFTEKFILPCSRNPKKSLRDFFTIFLIANKITFYPTAKKKRQKKNF